MAGVAMIDPTLATVDDEPWNQPPTQRKTALDERRAAFTRDAPVLAIEKALSIGERIYRGMAILTPDGKHAEHVYDLSGYTRAAQQCNGCSALCILTLWTELAYAPDDPIAKKHGRAYRVVRDMKLCNACGNKFRGLPLGERWPVQQ